MRKALALLLAVTAGVVVAGLVIPSTEVTAGSSTLTSTELGNELRAISSSRSFQCYLDARAFLQSNGQGVAPALTGVSTTAWSTGAAVEWSNIRTTELLVDAYVASHDPSAFTTSSLTTARTTLGNAITSALQTAINDAQSNGGSFACPGEASGPSTLASLPAWFQLEEVRGEAGLLGLANLVPSPIATSGTGLRTWYTAHTGEFDTTCLSDLRVASELKADAVAALVDNGLAFATAVTRYTNSSAIRKVHGVVGCYAPTSPSWTSIVEYVGPVATGKTTVVQGQDGWYVLSPTSRRPNALRSILREVQTQVRALNVQSAQLLATQIQAAAHVTVSPSLGAWISTSTGGTIVAPSAPPPLAILNASANTPAG